MPKEVTVSLRPFSSAATLRRARVHERGAGRVLAVVRLAHAANDAGYTIDLPAKPTVEEQPVAIGGASMPMRMQAAHVDGAVFAVGTLTLPDDRDDTRRAARIPARRAVAQPRRRAADGFRARAARGRRRGERLELRVAGAAAGGDRAQDDRGATRRAPGTRTRPS